uniref:Uncharacterized protein n=1 Tax=Candidatus Kentrum sp. FW TaxID=2126338 RepID=A0A450TSH4_9GAMM|nr:MAG: hypothetical protein BECKFW1821C_GA0114237_10278 [Candidatus Kentron sp. FW]
MSMGFVGCKEMVGKGVLLALMGMYSWYPRPIDAVEVAPRITDREIIESLSTLKEGQKALEQRFDSMEKRFNDQLEVMDQQSKERFEAMDKRFGDLHWVFGWVLNLLPILIVGVLGILGFVIRDRGTALRPMVFRAPSWQRQIKCMGMKAYKKIEIVNAAVEIRVPIDYIMDENT